MPPAPGRAGSSTDAARVSSKPVAMRRTPSATGRAGRPRSGLRSGREERASTDASADPARRVSAAQPPLRSRPRPGPAGAAAENSHSGEEDFPLAGETESGGLRHPLALSRGTTRPGGWHSPGSRLPAPGRSRLPAPGSRLSALGSRLSALGSRLSALGSRLSRSRLSALGSRLSALGSRLSALGSRLSALGSRLLIIGNPPVPRSAVRPSRSTLAIDASPPAHPHRGDATVRARRGDSNRVPDLPVRPANRDPRVPAAL